MAGCDNNNWNRVSRNEPCPICGKPDNCTVSADGGAVWCGRISEGSIRENAGGQFLHVLRDHQTDDTWQSTHPRHKRPKKPKFPEKKAPPRLPPNHWANFAEACFQSPNVNKQSQIAHQRRFLSSKLGVSVESLVRLRVGWHESTCRWTFPEQDARGQITGILGRSLSGQKKILTGGKHGLIYATDWDTGSGPVLAPEGASDVATLMDLDVSTIGRFSNRGGAGLLCEMLIDFPVERDIIIIGERDQKPDGKWPGKEGAIATARKLAETLQRPIGWAFPPDGAKDSRIWLNATHGSRADFLASLEIDWIRPTPIYDPAEEQEAVTLQSWRERLNKSRQAILDQPGFYLDNSPTGAGKSHGDIALVQRAKTSLIVMPTHGNCTEVEADMRDAGINATAFPARLTEDKEPPCPRCQFNEGQDCSICGGSGQLFLDQNCWNFDADLAQEWGLPVVSAICPSCPHKNQCLKEGYLQGIHEASESQVAIATHARGQFGGIKELGEGRDYQAIHEDAMTMLRPKIECGETELAAAIRVIEILLTDPGWLNWFGNGKNNAGRKRRGEIYDFINHLLTVAVAIADQTRFAEETSQLNLPDRMPKPSGVEAVLFKVANENGAYFSEQPLRLLIAAASGELHQAGVIVDEPRPEQRRNTQSENHPRDSEKSTSAGRYGTVF